MELKEAINFSLLEKYIIEKERKLNCFEDIIINALYPYYKEYQLFFFVKKGDMNLSFLEQKYAEVISDSISSMQIVKANDEGYFYVKLHQVKGWEAVTHPLLKDNVYVPIFYDVWNPFPLGLVENYDYVRVYQDMEVDLILFPSRIIECFGIDTTYNRNLFQYGFFTSQEKACDILRDNIRNLSYHYLSNGETYDLYGTNEYFRLSHYYQEQKEELERILKKKESLV